MDKRIILFSFLLIIGSGVSSQESYQIPKKATVNASDSDQDLFPQIIYRGEVSDGMSSLRTDHLQKVKSRVQKRYPRKTGIKDNSLRGAGPKVLQSFEGIQGSLGIPLDNHLAVSNNGHVVTVANFHLVIYDDSANISTAISLIQLTRDLRLPDFRYDPRIIYDTEEDRFILTMLHSSDRDRTLILVGFSETSDPNGNWHFYTIDGNPFDINIFSDYPMVAITKDKFYFTVNAVDVDSTWQDGFVETYIWEIDKFSGYNGDSLEAVMYNEILFGGQPIRNLCPITPANEGLLDKQYFLSNRNFAVENDTFFLVTLDNGLVDVRTLIADTPYGVPPNAVQNNSLTLQTNDARVLDAFYLDGKVQFVNNCVNPVNGFASIYHGRIADIENSNSVSGDVIAYGDLELGYPDISYAGVQPGEDHSIIVVSHVGEGRFPGISALEYDGSTYSELVTLHEGTGVINQIGGSLQRWGDYSGNQRIYNLPGACWTVSSFGRSNREYGVGINELSRSDINVSSRDVQHIPHKIYPNPVSDWVEIEFEIPSRSLITINLFDLRGQGIREIVTTTPKKTGQATFRFATDHLSSGTYIISASSEEGILFSDRIIISN